MRRGRQQRGSSNSTNNSNPSISIEVAKNVLGNDSGRFKTELKPEDFILTWKQFLQKYRPNLFKELNGKGFIIQDIRNPESRKVFSLDNTVESFVNGFEKSRKLYRAKITAPRPNMDIIEPKRSTQASTSRRGQEPVPSSSRVVNGQDGATAGKKRHSTRNVPIHESVSPPKRSRNVAFNVPDATVYEEDELNLNVGSRSGLRTAAAGVKMNAARTKTFNNFTLGGYAASQTGTVHSQLSQASSVNDLEDAGIDYSQNIGPRLVNSFAKQLNSDNLNAHRITLEIRNAESNGKWLKFARYMPTTAALLQVVFRAANE